jgi:hypothetical protein
MTEHRLWAIFGGVQPPHILRAALHVAALIDSYGSSVLAAQHNYGHYPSGGIYPPEDLRLGEELLIRCGLLRNESGILYPTQELVALLASPEPDAIELLLGRTLSSVQPISSNQDEASVEGVMRTIEEILPDPDRREAFLLAAGRRYSASAQVALGNQGEEAVANMARSDLQEFGRPDLASQVRRVSCFSDQLGYDVVAPRIDHGVRRLEVKTMGHSENEVLHFFLSRNEVDTGRRESSWALVVCQLEVDKSITVLGWCRGCCVRPISSC